ncbi:gamma-glutamyltranspeptidase / glutathione hydrolase [Hyphomicrobium sp. 1Nfss2.1]|uniref:gamma-glutamyltransferase n=1 Tax=Hyphomicrobium sp. 1Nfss2.1 TaxID=3413936 RepID=UPI003C7B5C6E
MILRLSSLLALALAAVISVTGVQAQLLDPRSAPEGDTGLQSHALAKTKRHMIAAANVHAAEAGREMLRAGGSAIDAAIAAQLVLNIVEPQSSGIGGGAFLLYWDSKNSELKSFDGRETAPAAARPDRFLVEGKPMPFNTAVLSGLSIGVPGVVRLMEDVHAKYGKLPWAKLFEPAIRLAENGFRISPRLHLLLRLQNPDDFVPAARAYFFTSTGSPLPIGHELRNPQLAETLQAIAAGGAKAFYEGPIAEAIVKAVNSAPIAPGGMTLDDLKNYQAKERPPLCVTYRTYEVCGMGPPSSGGLTVAQTLKLLEPFDLGKGPGDALNARAVHTVAEAEKLAFADRNRYIGDPDFVSVPEGLLDDAYVAQRRALIKPDSAATKPAPGEPPGLKRQSFGVDATIERSGTSHISVIDDAGNALSMTTTIEGAFGSHNWAAGFLLNNQLTDFSFVPVDADGRPAANAVGPGKRPRSSMAPTIVFDTERHVTAVLGSPGGSRIILYVLKTLIGLIDWGLDAQQAADLLNFGSQGSVLELEPDWSTVPLSLTLKPIGHTIVPSMMNSGVHILTRREGHIEGGADARREGAALGD